MGRRFVIESREGFEIEWGDSASDGTSRVSCTEGSVSWSPGRSVLVSCLLVSRLRSLETSWDEEQAAGRCEGRWRCGAVGGCCFRQGGAF